MKNIDLSVIILSYNTKDITKKCLNLLQASIKYCGKKLNNKIEVIVVDNASADGSPDMIREFKWVKLIALSENTGFSKGNNIGIGKSKSPLILLLNSDAYVEENTLYKALAYFRVNLNCDALGCKLKYNTGKFQPSAGNLPGFINILLWISGLAKLPLFSKIAPFHPTYQAYFKKAHQVGWVMGAFLMLKRKVLEGAGGFDENIFMHMEEIELSKRIQDKGFKVWFVPTFEVVHLHGASSRFETGVALYNELKGVKYYFKKHYKNWYWYIKLALIKGLILRTIIFSVLRKPVRAKIYREGLKVV